jgi:HEAT repeat protein
MRAGRDPDARVRQAVLACTWNQLTRHLVPLLRDTLASKNEWERERAAVLSFLSVDALRPELERALADPEFDVRVAALDTLTQETIQNSSQVVEGEAARDVAARMLLDPSPAIASFAAGRLALATSPLTTENTRAVVEALRRVILGEIRISGGIGDFLELPQKLSDPAALAQLYALVGSPKSILASEARFQLRGGILNSLTRLWSTPAARAEGIGRHLPEVPDAEGKVFWLRRWRDSNVTADAAYAVAAQAPEPEVRLQAYKGLLLKNPIVLPEGVKLSHLAEDLVSTDPEMRSPALTLAESFPDPKLAEALRVRVTQPDKQPLALRVLALSADRDALPQLREAAISSNQDVQTEAVQQILRVLGDESLEEFLALARKTNASAPLMADLRGPLLEKYVEQLPDDLINANLVFQSAWKLPPEARARLVRRALRRDDSGVLVQAALAIDVHQLEEFIPDLLRLLESPHQTVRERAKAALKNLREYRELRAGFEQYGKKGRAGAVAEARGLLESPDPLKRRGAAMQALERLGGRPPK